MIKLCVNQIIEAADSSDAEDIELRRLIAEALLASDLDLPLIAAGGAASTQVFYNACPAWRAGRAKAAPRQH